MFNKTPLHKSKENSHFTDICKKMFTKTPIRKSKENSLMNPQLNDTVFNYIQTKLFFNGLKKVTPTWYNMREVVTSSQS